MQAVLSERRNGQGDLAVTADLTGAELVVAPLEWRKPRDATAKASARVLLDHDRLTAIDAVQLDGDGLVLRGRARFQRRQAIGVPDRSAGAGAHRGAGHGEPADGGPDHGQSQRCDARSGAASWPRVPRRTRRARDRSRAAAGPPWMLDAKFDRVLMAQGGASSDVIAHAEHDGRMVRQLRIEGRTGPRAPFSGADRSRSRRAPPHRQRGRRRRAAAWPGLCAQHAGREAVGAGAVRRCAAGPSFGRVARTSRISASATRRRWASCCRR